jgi:hypothetical protein
MVASTVGIFAGLFAGYVSSAIWYNKFSYPGVTI